MTQTITSGPWQAAEQAVYGPEKQMIAKVAIGSDKGGNVHLIAAAPELLEALNYLLEQTIDQDLKYGIGLSEGEEDARKQALAAIAKATGNKVLPPDPDGKNDDRAVWAGRAIEAFRTETGTDLEDALSDLLGDLMHWADRNDFDFNAALDRGRWHYDAETGGEEE